MTSKFRRLAYLGRYFGVRWVAYRAAYAASRTTGLLGLWERLSAPGPFTPCTADGEATDADGYRRYRLHGAPAFFFSCADRRRYRPVFDRWDRAGHSPQAVADAVALGTFRYFEHAPVHAGCPPDWHLNPFTGVRACATRHWSRVDEAALGDVKAIWEPSRFGFTYALVRAYWRTGDERYAERFWGLVEDWETHNPAWLGVNWRCAQEVSFRAMAWCFALYGFADASPTSAARVLRLAKLLRRAGTRIERDLRHAISQQNNHGISAGVGLLTIGTLFPEFPEARRWRRKGRRAVEALGRTLIYDDGAFAQHSTNYHRLMLHDYLWAFRLTDVTGEPLTTELRDRVARAGEFLFHLQDDATGRAPQYGHNDGALVLPLNNCDCLDYRPVTQAIAFLVHGTRRWASGPWDEDLLWLFGPDALCAERDRTPRPDFRAPIGGYYVLRGKESAVVTRCGTYRHRPAQPDMMHVDLWWRGENLAIDAGTYSYGDGQALGLALSSTAAHNTVTVDGQDQMERFGKFLWFPWLRAKVEREAASPCGVLKYFEGGQDGYLKRGVSHRRAIACVGPDAWVVIDWLSGNRPHRFRLHWLFADIPFVWDAEARALVLRTAAGSYCVSLACSEPATGEVVRADDARCRGWRAAYYYDREPAISATLTADAPCARFITVLAPTPVIVTQSPEEIRVAGGEWATRLVASRAGGDLVGAIEMERPVRCSLAIA